MALFKYSVPYLGGIPSCPTPCKCRVQIADAGVSLVLRNGAQIFIPIEDIADVQVLPYLTFSPPGGTSKSVVGRAIVGEVLLGPLGAVVGAMSGRGARLSREQQRYQFTYVLAISANEYGIRYRCGFRFSSQRAAQKLMDQIQQLRVWNAQQQQHGVASRPSNATHIPAPTPPLTPPLTPSPARQKFERWAVLSIFSLIITALLIAASQQFPALVLGSGVILLALSVSTCIPNVWGIYSVFFSRPRVATV
ncbi:MAG: hypothetical protein ACP5I8_12175 [Phycisphaerae bacterium]